jgi:hypothetical protein
MALVLERIHILAFVNKEQVTVLLQESSQNFLKDVTAKFSTDIN